MPVFDANGPGYMAVPGRRPADRRSGCPELDVGHRWGATMMGRLWRSVRHVPTALRATAFVAVAALVGVQGGQAAQALPGTAATPATPGQQTGTAAGKKHAVPASATSSRARTVLPNSRPGQVKGAVGAYKAHGAKSAPVNSGSRIHKAPKPVAAPAAKKHRGFVASTSVEQPKLDTATTTVFKNADGTYTAQVHTRAVNYRKSDGTWARIPAGATGTVTPGTADAASYRTAPPRATRPARATPPPRPTSSPASPRTSTATGSCTSGSTRVTTTTPSSSSAASARSSPTTTSSTRRSGWTPSTPAWTPPAPARPRR